MTSSTRTPTCIVATLGLATWLSPAVVSAVPVTSGLVLQLDAGTGVTLDGGPTGPNGQPRVNTWGDQAALGGITNAVQAANNRQPEFFSSVPQLNNQPALHFYGYDQVTPFTDPDGASDLMMINGIGSAFTSAATVFVVATPEHLPIGNKGYTLYDTGSADDWWNFSGGSGYSAVFRNPRFEGTMPTGGAPLSGSHIMEISTGSVYSWFNDGTLNNTGAPSFATGPNHEIGGSIVNGFPEKAFRGYVAEILVYNRVLTRPERNEVGDYLADKYGLTTSYIPEPASGALALIGMATMSQKRRRRG